MKTYLLTILAILIYRVMESLDGEKGLKLIDYNIAQKFKLQALKYID